MKRVTKETTASVRHVLFDGITTGEPKTLTKAKVFREILKGKRRAGLVAQVHAVKAHAEGQLDAMQSLGHGRAGIVAEWVTGDDPCPECSALAEQEYSIADARGMIPVHPGCVCSWRPVKGDARWPSPGCRG